MHTRIRKLRRYLDLTQAEFAKRIGYTQNGIASYEIGRRNPSNSVINNICKTFSVNEEWLRTGAGNMFVERTNNEELAAFVDDVMKEQSDSFRARFVAALSRLDTDAWEAIENFARSLVSEQEQEADEIDIEKEVAAYRAQLEAEKKAAAKLKASPGTQGAKEA